MATQYRFTNPKTSLRAPWEPARCEIWNAKQMEILVVANELRGRILLRVYNSGAVGRCDFVGLYAQNPETSDVALDKPKQRVQVHSMKKLSQPAAAPSKSGPAEREAARPAAEPEEPEGEDFEWFEHLSDEPWGSGWFIGYVAWDYASERWQLLTSVGPTPAFDCRHEPNQEKGGAR